MKETLERQKAENKEITVKTARGEEFKFGGISEKFTRKLYEWEQQRNIAPELSTIALLGSHCKKQDAEASMSLTKKLSSDALIGDVHSYSNRQSYLNVFKK